MKVCSDFSNMEELQKESDAVTKKAMSEELKRVIPDPTKDAMSVDILPWAMNQADFGDAGQRLKWAKYRQYRRPHNHHAALYFTTNTVVVTLEEDQERVTMKVEEEDAMAMVVMVPKPGHRSMPIELDFDDEEETMAQVEEKTKTKAKTTRRCNRLQGPRG
ncbi:Chitinase domain-containing protein 1 [Hordeum vulgare]|nr:Chitinase domain-containing protein 1 [Hordeum vulgare]